MNIPVVRTIADLQRTVGLWRLEGCRVGVVPTMGALHEGHLSLVREALARTDRVIVTLFVNPRQFNSRDDLAAYPRNESDDAAKLAEAGAELLFCPAEREMYPDGFATTVSVTGISEGLCGKFRPGHFEGVATIVTKLLLQTRADLAFFGEKDFQQLQVIRRLVSDLHIPTTVIGCPTVREADGLALSSRNLLLSPAERIVARSLSRVLFETADRLRAGEAVERALAEARHRIGQAGFRQVEYLELRAEAGLRPIQALDTTARLLVAAWLGSTRLIDNVRVLDKQKPAPALTTSVRPVVGRERASSA